MALAEGFEQQLGAGLGERHIAEFIDDQQFDCGELGLKSAEASLVTGFHQLAGEVRGGEEGDGKAALAGGETKRQADMGLARAARSRVILPGIWRSM